MEQGPMLIDMQNMVKVIDERVNGRELHEYLKSRRKFSDWMKQRIESYSFHEGRDYNKFVINSNSAAGRPTIEYSLTLHGQGTLHD
jgi:phage anti-repressor protein